MVESWAMAGDMKIEKGLPFAASFSADRGDWNVLREDLHFPVLVLRDSALSANIHGMAEWCWKNGFELAPHGKTTMCPRIFERQMDAGAWGITVATVSQALVALQAGMQRVLIANQVVGVGNLRSLACALSRYPDVEFYCLVDSVEGVACLADGLSRYDAPRPPGVLIEIGKTGWRTGARSEEAVEEVYEAVLQRGANLTFRGIEAFEGLAKNATEAEEFVTAVAQTAERIAGQSGASDLIFSAGGSSYLAPVARVLRNLSHGWKRLLRSGCYVTHDHGIYAQQQQTALLTDATVPSFTAALELWAGVQSMPDPGVAIVTFGKRDCAYDISLPVPLDLPGAKITAINDQHAYLHYPPDAQLAVGSILRFGISHPCTAFDKWRVIPLVDDRYNVIDLYQTNF